MLVIIRTRTEIKAARKVKRNWGSLFPYFRNTFTILEILNLMCNYAGLAMRIYYFFIPLRKNWNQYDTRYSYVDFNDVATAQNVIGVLRGVSVMTAAVLCLKYLELMPKTTTWYATGTTLGRAGRPLQATMVFIFGTLVGWAIVGEQWFGDQVYSFSTLWRSFLSCVSLMSGGGLVLAEMVEADAGLALPYFVGFYFTFYCALLPLILGILYDAWGVRTEQIRTLKQKLAQAKAARSKLAERSNGAIDPSLGGQNKELERAYLSKKERRDILRKNMFSIPVGTRVSHENRGAGIIKAVHEGDGELLHVVKYDDGGTCTYRPSSLHKLKIDADDAGGASRGRTAGRGL